MTKNAERRSRAWPQRGDLDVDYATGRELTGEWTPTPSYALRDRFDAGLAGAPQFCTLQLDTALGDWPQGKR